MRAVLRDPQLVEQLVEVPTIVSFASLLFLQVMQWIAEQNVDIPVVGGRGAGGGLSGFLPGQSYFFTAEQIVDNPVPWPGGAGGLQVLPRGQRFNCVLGPNHQVSCSRWRSSRFSASPGVRSVFFGFSWTSWSRGF